MSCHRSIFTTLVVSIALIVGASQASATPISLSNITVREYSPGNVVTAVNEHQATDGNTNTAFYVETARNPSIPSQGLGGFEVQWDFDVSGYTSIDHFTFNFLGRLADPSSFDSIQFRSIGVHTQPSMHPDSLTTLVMPDGALVSSSLSLLNGAVLPKNELGNYVSGGMLTIYTSTTFGFSSLPSISLEFFEISADIQGTSVSVPGPASLLLLLSGALLMQFRKWLGT